MNSEVINTELFSKISKIIVTPDDKPVLISQQSHHLLCGGRGQTCKGNKDGGGDKYERGLARIQMRPTTN